MSVPVDGGCGGTVITTIQLGIPVARIEIIDEQQLDLVNRYSKTKYPWRRRCSSSSMGSARRRWTSTRVQLKRSPPRTAHWVSAGQRRRKTGRPCGKRATTCCMRRSPRVPAPSPGLPTSASRSPDLSECILETQDDLRRSQDRRAARRSCRGWQLSSDLHGRYRRRAEMERVKAANARLVERALRLGGTCTGEHGVGFGKMKYLKEEHGDSLETMRAIKRALDPTT